MALRCCSHCQAQLLAPWPTLSCHLCHGLDIQEIITPVHLGTSFRERRASNVHLQGSSAHIQFMGTFI